LFDIVCKQPLEFSLEGENGRAKAPWVRAIFVSAHKAIVTSEFSVFGHELQITML
jgi:hypothetical protein